MFKTVNGGKLPERATKYSAGFDVFANEDMVIGAGETKLIGLGICLDQLWIDQTPELYSISSYLELHPRSSLRLKGIGGGVGIIDMDYRDEIKMVVTNMVSNTHLLEVYQEWAHCNHSTYKIKKGDKIGQLILKRHEGWLLSAEHTKDVERTGGFGSSGTGHE